MAVSITVDIYARSANCENEYIPSPVSEKSPKLNCNVSFNELLGLLHYSHLWIYDSATKKIITLRNVYDLYGESSESGSSGDTYTKSEIDQKIKTVSDATIILNEKLNSIPSNLIPEHYEKNTEYATGKLLWIEPGNLYQVVEDCTSANETTTEDSLIADVSNGKLVSVAIQSGSGDYDTLYTQVNQLAERVSSLQNRMEFSTIESFPQEGNSNTLYIDTSSGESYLWNDEISEYQRLDMETLDDIETIQSHIE